MDNDTQKQLLDYLKNAIAVETDVATQEQLLEHFSQTHEEKKPKYEPKPEPEPPHYEDKSISNSGGWCAAGSVFLIMSIILLIVAITEGMIIILPALIMGAFGILFISPFIAERKSEKEQRQRYYESMSRYQEQKKKVDDENKKMQALYWENSADWKKTDTEIKSFMGVSLAQTKDLLNKLYSIDTIYPKYRTLPALTSIYEYFVTGRCEELTGPHGAYNLYEDELRKDMIVSKLSLVIQNLEAIKQNQYMLYQQVKAIQENTDAITAELHQIKGYTVAITQLSALNTYYTALNERNNRIMMYYHL